MRDHRYDEFSVNLRWKQPERGSHPRVSTPGFYVSAGWSNEGAAYWTLDNLRLTDDDFDAIMDVLDSVGNCDGSFTAAGRAMLSDVADVRIAYRQMLQDRITRAKVALAEMDAPNPGPGKNPFCRVCQDQGGSAGHNEPLDSCPECGRYSDG